MEALSGPSLVERGARTLTYLVPRASDANVGSARSSSSSLSGLISTLVPTLIIAVVMVIAFLFLRRTQQRQYAPRTYLGSLTEQERTPELPKSMFGWIPAFNKIPDSYVLQHNSLDGYFVLRYLKIAIIITFLGCCLTWTILFPVNATGHGGQKQLDILSFSNIVNKQRYYAHTFVAWIFFAGIFYMVTRETLYFINVRNAYMLSPIYAARMSSRTVLFTSLPAEFVSEAKIRAVFGSKLKNVWIATNTKELEDKVGKRDGAAMKLEGGETKLIKLTVKARMKAAKEAAKKGGHDAEKGTTTNQVGENSRDTRLDASTNQNREGTESGAVASQWIKPKDRPTHKLGKFGLYGKKVDTINWSRSELQRLIPEIKEEQHMHRSGDAKPTASVFVEFYNQTEAQAAYQMGVNSRNMAKEPRIIGMTPGEVVWSNLSMSSKSKMIRNALTITLVVLTIIFWSIPVAVVGSISNINYLTTVVPFLSFINKCPKVILGVITSLLPSIMLAVLMALLPIYLRFMSKMAGLSTFSAIELRTQGFYFWFQVIQVFIVTTLTSAASAAVPAIIKNPSTATTLLAENLPKASNFYISYFILQGLTFSAGALLQIVGLILGKVLAKLLGSTPRKQYSRWANLSALGWGTVVPILSSLTVIAITYAIIAPLVMGFATVGLALFYFAYRYNLLFVNTSQVDTKGLIYPKALQHTLVGCYLGIVCLIGLFAIKVAIGPLVLMIVFLVFCAVYHALFNNAIEPMIRYLPRSKQEEEARLVQAEQGNTSKSTDGDTLAEKDGMSPNRKGDLPASGYGNGSHSTDTFEPPPLRKKNPLTKFLAKSLLRDTHKDLVNNDFAKIQYSEETEKEAYYDPAVVRQTPLIWMPRDDAGVSREEVAHTSKVTPATDEAAFFDDKGKMHWDQEGTNGQPPVYQEKIFY